MTVIVEKRYNPAAKRYQVVRKIARVTHARPHGRPCNVGKRVKWKNL